MKTLVIINPAAGGGNCGKKAPDALDALHRTDLNLEIIETQGPGDASRIAKEGFSQGVRHFIAVGGDGTSCELINGFLPQSLETQDPCTLGFLPLGTGNSFLRDFTVHGGVAALNAIRENRSRPCDVNALHHKEGTFYSLNILSMGFTANVGAVTNRRFKLLGEAGYILGVVATLARLKPMSFSLTVDGKEEPTKGLTFLSLNNSQFTGGKMRMAPGADTADGFATMVEVNGMSRGRLLQIFPKIFSGTHINAPEISERNVREIVFRESFPMDVMADGEVIRLSPTKLEVCPNALRVQI